MSTELERDATTPLPERLLDVLRAIAVLSVVCCHYLSFQDPTGKARILAGALGNYGVLLFFVHTALVLMGSLERQTRDNPGASSWRTAFYVRRVFRIYPLAIVALLLVLASGQPGAGRAAAPTAPGALVSVATPRAVTANLLLVQNLAGVPSILGTLWTLPIELQMYLMLPLCFLAARRGAAALAGVTGALVAAYVVIAHPIALVAALAPALRRLTVFEFGPCFLAGVFAYYLLRRRTAPRLPAWSLLPILVLVGVYLAIPLVQQHRPLTWIGPIALGALLPFLRNPLPSAATRWSHTICTYSYGIYLFHVPVLWLAIVKLSAAPMAARIAVGIGGCILLPVLGYHLIEKPGIDLGRAISERRPLVGATASAA